MIKIILLSIGGLIALIVVGFVLLIINQMIGTVRQRKKLWDKLSPVLKPLHANQTPDPREVRRLAMNLETRAPLWHALVEAGHPEHFPNDIVNRAAYAESDLAVWLAHPNELKSIPDEMQLAQTVTIDTAEVGPVEYYCFKFRTTPPHWAAKYGWIAGISGPYLPGSDLPKSRPPGTFSELDQFDTKSPDEHVRAIHEAGVKRGTINDFKKP